MATDTLIAKGGKLATLSDETVQELTKVLPSYCSKLNPIDILEEATTDRFKKVFEICLKDKKAMASWLSTLPKALLTLQKQRR